MVRKEKVIVEDAMTTASDSERMIKDKEKARRVKKEVFTLNVSPTCVSFAIRKVISSKNAEKLRKPSARCPKLIRPRIDLLR